MSSGTRTQWVTFACFGTLVDWRPAFVSALTPLVGDQARDVVRSYETHARLVEREATYRSHKDVLALAMARAAADCGVRVAGLDDAVLEGWASIRPFDDVEFMLAELRLRGVRLAVLSNSDDDLFETTHAGFRTPFDLFLTAQRVRGYKPALWHFRAFERLTGVARPDWVHVGSSWCRDIAPARAIGVRSVWLDRERTGEDGSWASAHVASALGLADVLHPLFGHHACPAGVMAAPGCGH